MEFLPDAWEKTLRKSSQWLKELGLELGSRNANATLLVLRSVLHALRDRLPPDEAVQLAAEMPLLIKGMYFDGWDPSGTPVKARSKTRFLAMVINRMNRPTSQSEAERVTCAVLKLLGHHLSPGELRDVRGSLPAELGELFPTPERVIRRRPGGTISRARVT
jgi:uncharacterized protein (DUF2267 family)